MYDEFCWFQKYGLFLQIVVSRIYRLERFDSINEILVLTFQPSELHVRDRKVFDMGQLFRSEFDAKEHAEAVCISVKGTVDGDWNRSQKSSVNKQKHFRFYLQNIFSFNKRLRTLNIQTSSECVDFR